MIVGEKTMFNVFRHKNDTADNDNKVEHEQANPLWKSSWDYTAFPEMINQRKNQKNVEKKLFIHFKLFFHLLCFIMIFLFSKKIIYNVMVFNFPDELQSFSKCMNVCLLYFSAFLEVVILFFQGWGLVGWHWIFCRNHK